MAIHWDQTRIAALSNPELVQLRENAARKLEAVLASQCDQEISRRDFNNKPKRNRSAASKDPLRVRENELSADLGAFAAALSQKHDLSAETAREKSKGTIRFQSHQMTQSNGTAKLGGLQRAGKCKVDRYISYRLRDTVISLNIYLQKNSLEDVLEFQVFAPKVLLPDGEDVKNLRPGLEGEKESKLYPWGQRFTDLSQAKLAFENAIAQFVAN